MLNAKNKGLIIIPVYNEEENIERVIDNIRREGPSIDILAVDDGSTDDTSGILYRLSVNTINLPFNLGYGGALQTGFKYAVENSYDFVIQFDGDGQHDAKEIIKLVKALEEEKGDIVIGSRFMDKGSYRTSFSKRIGMALFRWLARIIIKQNVTDITSGFQALNKKAYTFYSARGNYPIDFPDADVIINMMLLGFKVVEVPVNMFVREKGKSMHSGFRVMIYVLKMLLSIFIVMLRKGR